MEVTKREILFSIIIVALMAILGIFIGSKIVENNTERNEKYYLALKIGNNEEQFAYALKTRIGNCLAYGELNAVDFVTIPEVSGEYSYIEKVTERYTRHVRTENYTDSKGKTRTRTVVEYSWDTINREVNSSKEFEFLGVNFSNEISGQPISVLDISEIAAEKDKIRGSYIYNDGFFESVGDTREKFYAAPKSFSGTMEVNFSEGALKSFNGGDVIKIHSDKSIDDVISSLESDSKFSVAIFAVVWVIITISAVVGFCYLENKWLE